MIDCRGRRALPYRALDEAHMSNEVGNRLNEISTELASILEVRIAELTNAMKSAEQVTRQIVSTEMEISRYRQLQDSLGGELGDLKRELGALRARADEVRSQHGGMLSEREKVREELARAERDAREAGVEAERSRTKVKELESETAVLKKENDGLQGRLKNLEESVARMRKLKEELMQSMTGLSKEMSNLNLGKE